jgi:hypothetical protein
MIKTIALCACLSLLTACGTLSAIPPLPAVDQPKPKAANPQICADLVSEPPPAGAIVQPETPDEDLAVSAFLAGEAAARDWGRQGWTRAAIAKAQDCPNP